jgi:Putative serine esterase (DUF676)
VVSFNVAYTDATGAPRVSGVVNLQDSTNPTLPVVVLLHGNNGTADDMVNPASHPGMNYDYFAPIPSLVDRGWHGYPNVGIWGVSLDPTKNVTSWQTALAGQGFGTAWYSQVDNAGLLATPVQELSAIVEEVLRRVPGDRKLALLAHSRGGLLARRFLVDNAGNAPVRGRLLTLITLHSPHLGSELANLANALNAATAAATAVNPAIGLLLGWLQAQVNAPSYQELAVGSAFLANLSAAEAAAGGPILPVHTFGGTSTLLSRSRTWVFTPGSAVPQVTSIWPLRVQFHWETVPVALPSPITGIPQLGLLAPELRDTIGDLLVSDARSRLPGERSHRANRLNHAEALWDPTLHQQVIAALRSELKTAKESKEKEKEQKDKEKDRKEDDKFRKEDDKLRKDNDKLRKDNDVPASPTTERVRSPAAQPAGPVTAAPPGSQGRAFIRREERPPAGRAP